MRSLNVWGLLLLLSTVTACSSKPSAKELTKELKTVESWTQTAHMVGDSWVRETVPTPYAKQTLQKTQKELHNETDTLNKVAPTQDRKTVMEQVQRLEYTIGEMTTAVKQNDRKVMTQQLQQLSTQEQAMKALIGRKGGQP
ncbi:MAG TPA: hypothetical protein V6D33_19460 [Cyanophyceae cyanobacterium]